MRLVKGHGVHSKGVLCLLFAQALAVLRSLTRMASGFTDAFLAHRYINPLRGCPRVHVGLRELALKVCHPLYIRHGMDYAEAIQKSDPP